MAFEPRPPLLSPADPSAIAVPIRCIQFRHPAYSSSNSPLLSLRAVDDGGLDYYIAFLSCCIVTGNTWNDGWLAVRNPGGAFDKIERPADGILREAVYFFFVSNNPKEQYPVLPSFDHWRFPHGNLPVPWSDLAVPLTPPSTIGINKTAAMIRDVTCRLTGYTDACEVAHLVPISAGNWFMSNDMTRYRRLGFDHTPIDDQNNLILLRRDLHHLFDQRRFFFAVKRYSTSTAPKLTTHILLPRSSPQLLDLYHNRSLHAISNIAPELLFARFAWSIFSDENMPFFGDVGTYKILLFDPDTAQTKTETLEGGSKTFRETATLFPAMSKSRSVSPKKRQRDESGVDDMDRPDDELTDEDEVARRHEVEMEMRGRPRKRKYIMPRHSPSPPRRNVPGIDDGSFASASATTSETAVSRSQSWQRAGNENLEQDFKG